MQSADNILCRPRNILAICSALLLCSQSTAAERWRCTVHYHGVLPVPSFRMTPFMPTKTQAKQFTLARAPRIKNTVRTVSCI